MDNVNKTLYIPLYGKAAVSEKGIILHDPKAQAIWQAEGFALRGKAKSKWLTYYMGMRAAVFDKWLRERLDERPSATVLQFGCGMDSRIDRVGTHGHRWYDVDFPAVIGERKKYYEQTKEYRMLEADARQTAWLDGVAERGQAVVVMEGFAMYLKKDELLRLLSALTEHFSSVAVLADCYTVWAAKVSKYKNPINEVGVTQLYGVDDPRELEAGTGLKFRREHALTPRDKIDELRGFERAFFKFMFAGNMAKKLYRLYEYGAERRG